MADKTIIALTALALPNLDGYFAFDSGTQTFKVLMAAVHRRCLADVVVGSAVGCTHATLELALADVAVVSGMTLCLTESFNIAAKITISKSLTIFALPGVVATKTGGTIGLEPNVTGITIEGLRFAGYTVSGNKAISFTVTGTYGRVRNCNFAAGTDTDIDDASAPAGKKPLNIGNIVEV